MCLHRFGITSISHKFSIQKVLFSVSVLVRLYTFVFIYHHKHPVPMITKLCHDVRIKIYNITIYYCYLHILLLLSILFSRRQTDLLANVTVAALLGGSFRYLGLCPSDRYRYSLDCWSSLSSSSRFRSRSQSRASGGSPPSV